MEVLFPINQQIFNKMHAHVLKQQTACVLPRLMTSDRVWYTRPGTEAKLHVVKNDNSQKVEISFLGVGYLHIQITVSNSTNRN